MKEFKSRVFPFFCLLGFFLSLTNFAQAQLQTTGAGTYGTWPNNANYAVFSHKDQVNIATNYAFLQRNDGLTFINAPAGKHVRFRIGNVNAMILHANKRVGIGTSSPADKLHVEDPVYPSFRLSGAGHIAQLSIATNSGFYAPFATPGDLVLRSLGEDVILYSTNGDIRFGTETNNGRNEKMTLKSDGKLGIGTKTPLYQLDVDGEARADGLRLNGTSQPRLAEAGVGLKVYGRGFGGEISLVNFNFRSEQVNIGLDQAFRPGYTMTVDGKVLVEELRVQNSSNWPDYVFEESYPLQKLAEVEAFIKANKHLPEVPAASELTEGVAVGEMQKTLLKKIEELTLYLIDQDKRLEEIQKENQELKVRLNQLEQH